MSPSHFPSRSLLLLFGFALLLLFSGCSQCHRSTEEFPPWRFGSERADYEIVLPGEWRREPAGSINPHAELATSRDDSLFFLVIPQQLPSFPRPTTLELKETALAHLETTVDDFAIDRQGSIELDGIRALSVFASGSLDERRLSYITTYLTHGDFGYQLVAFSEKEFEELLIREKDIILSTWRFPSQRPDLLD